jgi:hypothetical protein
MTKNHLELVQIQPLPVERDANGYWSHPGIPDGDNNPESHAAFSAWLIQQGLTYQISSLEDEDDTHPVYHSYFEEENANIINWLPTAPTGDGWFTLSIHNTEDGPVWIWVRRADPKPEYAQVTDSKNWSPIHTMPISDDLVWLAKRDSIEGPRPGQHDDVNYFTHWALCEAPSFHAPVNHSRAIETAGKITHNMTVANQAAWIEWKHGAGADSAMEWIENGLIGPGLIAAGHDLLAKVRT